MPYAAYFPSSTGYYETASGQLMIKIWNPGIPTNLNINAIITNIEPINIPLEIDPGENQFRYANTKITFKYHESIELLLNNIESINAENKTFVDINLNGSLYWRGLVEWSNIRKSDYYIEPVTGNLKYKYITLDVNDAIMYLAKANKTLLDASYTDNVLLVQLLKNILSEAYISSSDVIIDSDNIIKIDEECGTSYGIDDLYIKGLNEDTLCTTFLKQFMIEFGCFIYIIKGKVYIVARSGGATLAIANSDILSYDKIENENTIQYINLYFNLIPADGWPASGGDPIQKTFGTKNNLNANCNYEIECNLLKKCFIPGDGSIYPDPPYYPTEVDVNYIIDDIATFLTNLVETGDTLTIDDLVYSFIMKGITETYIPFYSIDLSEMVGAYYYIRRGHNSSLFPRFKGELLVEKIASIYNDYFLNKADPGAITLHDISKYDNLSKRLVLFEKNYRAKNAKVDIVNNKIDMDLIKVS
ncbi:MAG: hypothetical protein WC473_06040 [Patescibacteria group bacterium]|jgi:hypothetical protein